jgi:hypothetical protein
VRAKAPVRWQFPILGRERLSGNRPEDGFPDREERLLSARCGPWFCSPFAWLGSWLGGFPGSFSQGICPNLIRADAADVFFGRLAADTAYRLVLTASGLSMNRRCILILVILGAHIRLDSQHFVKTTHRDWHI